MAKKYLNLEEAAAQLGMETEELNRLREAGDIRGFADRGAWKFRLEDIEELGRTRQADSDPAIPLFSEDADLEDDDLFDSGILDDENEISAESDSVIDEDEVGEQATVIRGSVHDDDDEPVELSSSDSDVRLVVDEGDDLQLDSEPELVAVGEDSDSDVSLTDDSGIDMSSDSDVKLVDADSEPDMELELDSGSDSDVKLVADDSNPMGSESDVALIGDDLDLVSDSDVALVSDEGDDSSILVEDNLSEDSGISLASDSGISLAGPLDSGISLEDADESGISLLDEDSGLSLADDESGISLVDDNGSDISITADSGISLESFDADESDQTSPMMAAGQNKDATMEIPTMDEDDDSSFDLSSAEDSSADTSVLMLDEEGEAGGSSGSVILDSDEGESGIFDEDDDFASDDGMSDVFDEDDDDFDDIYDADDDDFDDSFQSGESHAEFVAPASFAGGRGGAMAAPEPEWGVGTFVAMGFSTVLMCVCGVMMYDLVRTMWHYDDPSTFSSALLDTFGGLF
jgi:hypothetical protein